MTTATTKKTGIMKFDPTVTTGNILTGVTMLLLAAGAWFNVTARLDAGDVRDKVQVEQFDKVVAEFRDAQKEQRTEIKELQKSINAITTDTALIRGRLAGSDSPARNIK